MSYPFVGELRLVGFNFAPIQWALANGQLLAISQNTSLFSLLGTNFGGDGRSNFALPNLQGSIPIGAGQGLGLSQYSVGESVGVTNVSLSLSQLPAHNHTLLADKSEATANSPAGSSLAQSVAAAGNLYTTNTSPTVQMNTGIVTSYGGNLPHNNMMPYLTLNWIISLNGIFPPRP